MRSNLILALAVAVLLTGCSSPRINFSPSTKASAQQNNNNHLTPNYF